MQRLRVRFSRGDEIKFISHLDLMRCWERALRRAQVPLAYSEGFTPHPRISLAVPLAIGVTSEAELMDINLTRWVSPHWFTGAVSQQLPAGMGILGVIPVALTLQSLQSAVRFAEYRVNVESEMNPGEIQSKVDTLLSVQELPWRHQRDTGERIYDLRRLVEDVWVEEWLDRSRVLGMVLRCDSGGSGRPEQVALALGVSEYPRSIHRMKLTLAVQ
jgi:radical SAM-linked protein